MTTKAPSRAPAYVALGLVVFLFALLAFGR